MNFLANPTDVWLSMGWEQSEGDKWSVGEDGWWVTANGNTFSCCCDENILKCNCDD